MRNDNNLKYISTDLLEPIDGHHVKISAATNHIEIDNRYAEIRSSMIIFKNGGASISPLTVVKRKDGKYSIIDGSVRWEIAKKEKIEKLPCIVIKSSKSEYKYLRLRRKINVHRRTVTPDEELALLEIEERTYITENNGTKSREDFRKNFISNEFFGGRNTKNLEKNEQKNFYEKLKYCRRKLDLRKSLIDDLYYKINEIGIKRAILIDQNIKKAEQIALFEEFSKNKPENMNLNNFLDIKIFHCRKLKNSIFETGYPKLNSVSAKTKLFTALVSLFQFLEIMKDLKFKEIFLSKPDLKVFIQKVYDDIAEALCLKSLPLGTTVAPVIDLSFEKSEKPEFNHYDLNFLKRMDEALSQTFAKAALYFINFMSQLRDEELQNCAYIKTEDFNKLLEIENELIYTYKKFCNKIQVDTGLKNSATSNSMVELPTANDKNSAEVEKSEKLVQKPKKSLTELSKFFDNYDEKNFKIPDKTERKKFYKRLKIAKKSINLIKESINNLDLELNKDIKDFFANFFMSLTEIKNKLKVKSQG